MVNKTKDQIFVVPIFRSIFLTKILPKMSGKSLKKIEWCKWRGSSSWVWSIRFSISSWCWSMLWNWGGTLWMRTGRALSKSQRKENMIKVNYSKGKKLLHFNINLNKHCLQASAFMWDSSKALYNHCHKICKWIKW